MRPFRHFCVDEVFCISWNLSLVVRKMEIQTGNLATDEKYYNKCEIIKEYVAVSINICP